MKPIAIFLLTISTSSWLEAAIIRQNTIEDEVDQQINDNYLCATILFSTADDAQKALINHTINRSALVVETVMVVQKKWQDFHKDLDKWSDVANEKNVNISDCKESMNAKYHKYIQTYQDYNTEVNEAQHLYFGEKIDGVAQTALESLQKTVELQNSVVLCEDDICLAIILVRLKEQGVVLHKIEADTVRNAQEFIQQFPASLKNLEEESDKLLALQSPLIDEFITCVKTILNGSL